MSRYDMIRPCPLRPGPAVKKSQPIFIMVDEQRETMVKGQMLPGVRPGHSGAHPPPPPQPALVLRDQLVKGMWPDNRVTAWADQFMGTKLYEEALQCVKEGIQLCKDRDAMWKREDRMGNNVAARIKWEKDNGALRKKEDALRSKKKGLEERLVDSRIEEEKHRSR